MLLSDLPAASALRPGSRGSFLLWDGIGNRSHPGCLIFNIPELFYWKAVRIRDIPG